MKPRNAASAIVPILALAFLASFSIVWSEGVAGFAPLANIEGVLLVGLGTLSCLWMAYPLREIWRSMKAAVSGNGVNGDAEAARFASILCFAANASIGLGAITSLLGLILLFSHVDDMTSVPRVLAYILSSLFYGLVLSECLFMPLSRRLVNNHPFSEHDGHTDAMGGRRLLIAFIAAGTILTTTLLLLFVAQHGNPPPWQ